MWQSLVNLFSDTFKYVNNYRASFILVYWCTCNVFVVVCNWEVITPLADTVIRAIWTPSCLHWVVNLFANYRNLLTLLGDFVTYDQWDSSCFTRSSGGSVNVEQNLLDYFTALYQLLKLCNVEWRIMWLWVMNYGSKTDNKWEIEKGRWRGLKGKRWLEEGRKRNYTDYERKKVI